MKIYSKSFYPRLVYQAASIVIILILFSSTAIAQNHEIDLRLGVADPGHIPDFNNFESPGIVPGDSGTLKFTITNRYEINITNDEINIDSTMYNVTLVLNIYRYTTLEESKKIADISDAPEITGGNQALSEITDKTSAEFYWPNITPNQTVDVALSIKSKTSTPQGTYFVRMHLNFMIKYTFNNTLNNTFFDMKSRGHFTNSQWDRAQPNATDQFDPDNNKFIVGRLNLDTLGVDGLIPDTSIRIKEPIPIWPLYIFAGFAGLFLILAFVFYLMDEKGKFPNTKRKLDKLGEKMNNFRYRRE